MNSGRRVLVTGATGFLGKPTVTALAASGYEVHALTRQSDVGNPAVEWHQCNLFDYESMAALVSRIAPAALVHLAWDVTPGNYREAAANESWADASIALFANVAACGGRNIIAIGSAIEYDGSGVYYEDVTPLRTFGAYALAKQRTAQGLQDISSAHDVRWSFARVFQAYGTGEHPARAIPRIARSLIAKEPMQLGASTVVRDLIHVDDVASAICELLERPANAAVNVGTGKGTAMRGVFEAMAASVNAEHLLTFSDEEILNEPSSMIADVQRLRNLTGWRPSVSLDTGLERTFEWWQCQRQ